MDIKQQVTVTLPIEDWADVVAVIGRSSLELLVKDRLNEAIFDSVIQQGSS